MEGRNQEINRENKNKNGVVNGDGKEDEGPFGKGKDESCD